VDLIELLNLKILATILHWQSWQLSNKKFKIIKAEKNRHSVEPKRFSLFNRNEQFANHFFHATAFIDAPCAFAARNR